MTIITDLIEQLRQCGETRSADGRGSRICDEAADLIERVIGDLPQDAIDGGWTALGMSKYAKGLEAQVETLKREHDELSNALAAAKADAATAWERHAIATRLGNAARQELADAKQETEDIRAVLKAVSPRAFAQMEKISE